jgi:hypothetical protein
VNAFNTTDKSQRIVVARHLSGCIGRALAVFGARRPHGEGARP